MTTQPPSALTMLLSRHTRRERMTNPKCQTRPGFDTFSAKSADLTGLKMRRITRAASCVDGPRLARDHVWMAPAWQEIIWRAAQRSLAVMCPACWCSPGGLLALMGSANRVLI